MGFWYYFWTVNFIVAGSSFVLITFLVMVRGSKDLHDMLSRLKDTSSSSEHASDVDVTKGSPI
jgi:hypothetical protein